MMHVRAIALVPTSDDPTGLESLQNPASSAGRPVYEVRINEISMLGVILNNTTIEDPPPITTQSEDGNSLKAFSLWIVLGILALLTALALRAGRIIEPVKLEIAENSDA
jgi:hypothetical protein